MITLHREITLYREFPSGATSTWIFGELSDGRFGARCSENGKRKTFASRRHMDQCVRNYRHNYGYNPVRVIASRVDTPPREMQLSLAV